MSSGSVSCVLFGEGKVQYGDVWYRKVTVKLRFNLLIKVEPIFMHIKKSHTSRSKRDFLFICENETFDIK